MIVVRATIRSVTVCYLTFIVAKIIDSSCVIVCVLPTTFRSAYFHERIHFSTKVTSLSYAGHLLACGNSPLQFLQFVFFFGLNFDCFCRYPRLLRRLGYDFLTVFADSLSLCSTSKACFSDNYNARADESNHLRSVSSRRTFRPSHVE